MSAAGEDRGARIEVLRARELHACLPDLALLCVNSAGNSPEVIGLRTALDGLLEPSPGDCEIAVHLLEQCQLEVRRRRPRLNASRVECLRDRFVRITPSSCVLTVADSQARKKRDGERADQEPA